MKRSSEPMNCRNMDDLPDFVLVEILCRLPCNKLVFQCKCVCKRWSTLTSSSYFIGRFLRIQSDKQTPVTRTLIESEGVEFPYTMSSSSLLSNLFATLLKRLKSFYRLEWEPTVVGTYNDLVLCSDGCRRQDQYYICNPYTMQWVALPPTPTRGQDYMIVGFICDCPFYDYEEDDQKGHVILLNAEYRCKVVRILPPNNIISCGCYFNFNVEIFSSETGEWTESVLSCPQGVPYIDLDPFGFAYNGMLYWPGDHVHDRLLVLGLDPFNDNNNTSSSSSSNSGDIINHKCQFTLFDEHVADLFSLECLGVCGGCLRMCEFDFFTRTLSVLDLKQQVCDPIADGARKLCLSEHRVYSLEQTMYPDEAKSVVLLAFDPNNQDILYLEVDGDIVMWNIGSTKWSKTGAKGRIHYYVIRPFVLPWWPTPVPKLPHHAHQLAHDGGTIN